MALPMNATPTYSMIIPSTGKTVKYRPFLIKEEKALLIAQQSEEIPVMIDTLKNVIVNCTLDKIDTESLAIFDMEYMFTQIRSKSVGEIVDLYLKCDVDHGDDNKKAVVKYSLDLSTIAVTKDPEHTNKIELFDDVGVVMKYPSFSSLQKLKNLDTDNLDAVFEIVAECIEHIYTNEEVFYAKEQKPEELLEFLNNLTSEQFVKIQRFFSTMPKITKDLEYNCPVCSKKFKKTLEGIESFF